MAAMQQSSHSRSQEKAVAAELEDEQRLLATVVRAHLDTCDFTRDKVAPVLARAREQPNYTACPPTLVSYRLFYLLASFFLPSTHFLLLLQHLRKPHSHFFCFSTHIFSYRQKKFFVFRYFCIIFVLHYNILLNSLTSHIVCRAFVREQHSSVVRYENRKSLAKPGVLRLALKIKEVIPRAFR